MRRRVGDSSVTVRDCVDTVSSGVTCVDVCVRRAWTGTLRLTTQSRSRDTWGALQPAAAPRFDPPRSSEGTRDQLTAHVFDD